MARKFIHLLALLAVFFTHKAALANAITFFNTGVSQNGSLLSAGSADSHYNLIYNPDGILETAQSTAANNAWIGNSSTAAWISPGASGYQNWTAGYYVYETTLDLTGYIPTTAVLSGLIAADNGISIYLNRTGSSLFNSDGFSTVTGFTISSGFVSGVNFVDFVVRNDGGPTGLMVDNARATASASAVPEPAALILVASGIAVLYAVTRLLQIDRKSVQLWRES